MCVLQLGLAPRPADAQPKLIKNLFSHVMKSADVDAHFAKLQDSWDVYTKTNHAVTFRVTTRNLPATNHQEADEYWFVRKGTAKVTLQAGATPATASVSGGDVVVPRHVVFD
jgi:mannose-6-phosphate isomerase-like protein (cupin superfamily)